MVKQGESYVAMFQDIVDQVRAFSNISNEVVELGLRHKQYGVKPYMYAIMGRALICSLDELSGNNLDAE
eukprot:Pgem_evm1s17359